MSIRGDARITIFDAMDRRTYWARVGEELSNAAWFEAKINDCHHGGIGEGGWARSLREHDEGVTWIRGWYPPDDPAAKALLAAGLLDRSAA